VTTTSNREQPFDDVMGALTLAPSCNHPLCVREALVVMGHQKRKNILDLCRRIAVICIRSFQPYFSQRPCPSKLEKSWHYPMSNDITSPALRLAKKVNRK